MSFASTGTPVTTRLVFNSGTINFGNSQLVDIDNISLSMEFSTMLLYVLGSILGQDHVRHTAKATLTGKIKSFSPEADALAYGTSSIGSPNTNTVLDGQPTLTSPIVTLFDRNGKQIQYQFSGALFKSSKVTAKAEDYAEFDFELEAVQVSELYTA